MANLENAHMKLVCMTGGPGVGKTTLCKLARQVGFGVVQEFATEVILEGGPHPTVDHRAFQKEVLRRQVKAEDRCLHTEDTVILDRGVLDGLAYTKLVGTGNEDIFAGHDASHYALVMVVEPLSSFEQDGIRYEDLCFTHEITGVLEEVYGNQGVPVVRIPDIGLRARWSLILNLCSEYVSGRTHRQRSFPGVGLTRLEQALTQTSNTPTLCQRESTPTIRRTDAGVLTATTPIQPGPTSSVSFDGSRFSLDQHGLAMAALVSDPTSELVLSTHA